MAPDIGRRRLLQLHLTLTSERTRVRLTDDAGRRRLVIGIARRDLAAAAALVAGLHPATLHMVLLALSALQPTS